MNAPHAAAGVLDALREVLRPLIAEAVADALEGCERQPALLTRDQLALALQCCSKTIARLERDGLPCVRLGDARRYRLELVLAWLERRGQSAGRTCAR